MKTSNYVRVFFAGFAATLLLPACHKDNGAPTPNAEFTQTNLVSDTAGFGAARMDANLVNAWGIALSPTGKIWISCNGPGVSVVYDNTGQTVIPPVTIPAAAAGQTGTPSGVVYNSTPDFNGSKFIFVSEDGIVSAWTSGGAAVKMADQSAENAVYKGVAIGNDGGSNFLYVTNFKQSKIDVFDKNFNLVSGKSLMDPGIPADYGPFGIQNIGGKLYVTYAKHKAPDNHDDQAGPGNGYVDIFNPSGTLIGRLATQGTLNSPWGIAAAPAGFVQGGPAILIGNFGDGHINVYDPSGIFRGQLEGTDGQALSIDGLWGIAFSGSNGMNGKGIGQQVLYFTAGPDAESHGLFGTLQRH